MCQVYGPTPRVQCSTCGAGYYEDSFHECKKYVSFEDWDADLQRRAKEAIDPTESRFMQTLQQGTINVAHWPEWKRKWAWAEEYRFSVRE